MSNASETNDDVESSSNRASSSYSQSQPESNSCNSYTSYCSPISDASKDTREDSPEDSRNEDWESVNQLYLRKLEEYKERIDAGGEDEMIEDEVRDYCRTVHSAPLMLPKLSEHVSSLKPIEEKEECSLSTDSIGNGSEDGNLVVTPRQVEVPPKRKCVRAASPILLTIKKEELRDFPNQILNLGEKTFIVRSSRKTEKRSISIQANEDKKSSKAMEIGLPHSVEDGTGLNITLEPNIIVLDDKSPSPDRRNSPTGDTRFSGRKINSESAGKPRRKGRKKGFARMRSNRVGSSDFSKSGLSSEVSPESRLSPPSVQISPKSPSPPTRGRRRRLRRHDHGVLDRELAACRTLLGSFRLGPAPGTPPEDQEDPEIDDDEDAFRAKARDLLNEAVPAAEVEVDVEERTSSGRSRLLEARRAQVVDLEFYDVEETSREASLERAFEARRTGVLEDLGVEDADVECCFCVGIHALFKGFARFRFKRRDGNKR